MKFNIHGNKLEVTDAIKSYIEEKIGKLNKYFDNPDEIVANIVIRVKGIDQIVEVTIPAKKIILRAEDSNKDLYSAIDLVSEKLERQIIKNKTRMKNKVNKELIIDFNINFEEEAETEDKNVVKRKRIEMKPMSEEEAILQMNLLDHEFFIFKSDITGKINVLYKRKDGYYGIIETN